jgi:hypothetical protein
MHDERADIIKYTPSESVSQIVLLVGISKSLPGGTNDSPAKPQHL